MLTSLEDLLLFAYIYLFCFLGAFSKDMIDTFLDKTSTVLIIKILVSSLGVTIFLYGISESLLNKLSYRSLTGVCYTFGLISFEFIVKYSSMDQLLATIEEYKAWRSTKK